MGKNEEQQQDWLDAAFNEKETQDEIDRARRSRNIGCLIAAIVIIVAVVALLMFSCDALSAVVSA